MGQVVADDVIVERQGRLMVITINRPAVKNAINGAVSHAVAAALDELDADDSLQVAILTGAGGNFCSGMDLKAFLSGEKIRVDGRGILGIVFRPPIKPIIAAVEGYALAGGFEVVLACDLVVAANDAKFGLPEARRGLAAGAGGLIRLPRLIPQNIAMEYALTGDVIAAEELHRLGLINRLTPHGGALEAARALAARIIDNAPLSVAAGKRVIREQRDWTVAEMFERQRAIVDPVLQSEDAQEGAAAFVEKRKPNWKKR